LWNDELRVGLCPDRLVTQRRSAWPRYRVVTQSTIPVQGDPAERLKILARETVDRATHLTVILSNHYARYALLPWSDDLVSRSEWLAYAQHCFANIYGANAAAAWRIQIGSAEPGKPRLACAVDAALIDSLDALRRSEESTRLVSIQTHLVSAYNRCCDGLGAQPTWFVVHEPGRLTLGLIAARSWKLVRNRRLNDAAGDSLTDVLDRELALSGETANHRLILCSPSTPPTTLGRLSVEDITLRPGVNPTLRPYAMVLS
jgi:hypothetical protein